MMFRASASLSVDPCQSSYCHCRNFDDCHYYFHNMESEPAVGSFGNFQPFWVAVKPVTYWLEVSQKPLSNFDPSFRWCDSTIIIAQLFFQANYWNARRQMGCCQCFRLSNSQDYYKWKFAKERESRGGPASVLSGSPVGVVRFCRFGLSVI